MAFCIEFRIERVGPSYWNWMAMDGEVGHINIKEMLIMGGREMDAIYLILLVISENVPRITKTASKSCSSR